MQVEQDNYDILVEKIRLLLESQRCFLVALIADTINPGKHFQECIESLVDCNQSIGQIFDLDMNKLHPLDKIAKETKDSVMDEMELERIFALESPK